MRDLRQYWAEIRAIEAGLSEFLWVVDAAGHIVEVTRAIAARLLQGKSHRVASEDEVQAYMAKVGAENREAIRAELRRRGVDMVALK